MDPILTKDLASAGLVSASSPRMQTGRHNEGKDDVMTTATTTELLADILPGLASLDWTDLSSVYAATTETLAELNCDRSLLTRAATAITSDPHLTSLCEHYDILDKLVLHDDPAGWRLRLHVFLEGYYDRPHNHRWTYTSHILSGSYTHTLFGTDDDLTDTIDVSQLQPRLVRTEEPGDTYTLHHSMIHSVVAHGETVTLIVRGPAVKERFVVTDRVTGKAWWQYGAATEDPASAAAKRMSPEEVSRRVNALIYAGVLPPLHDS